MGDDGALLTALTLPRMLWTMATTLTPAERGSWLAWLWALCALRRLRAKRRQTLFLASPLPLPQEVTETPGVSQTPARRIGERMAR